MKRNLFYCSGSLKIIVLTGILLLGWLPALWAQTHHIGDVITNSDGSKGVVFYLKADGSGGWMVALNDASDGCPWGTNGNITGLPNLNLTLGSYQQCLADTNGYGNTQKIRVHQNSSDCAAWKVDFDNGWYLPATGQLRRLYAALPFIEDAITNAGGTKLTDNKTYWTSTPNSQDEAWRLYFNNQDKLTGSFNHIAKTTSCAVRAIRNFTHMKILYDTTLTYAWSDNAGSVGDTAHIRVQPAATTTYTVTATTDFGCSNTAQQTIIVGSAGEQTFHDTICQGEPYSDHGFEIAADTTQKYPGEELERNNTLYGSACHTDITLLLYIKPKSEYSFNDTICENTSYYWNSVAYSAPGDYVQHFTNVHGCDSMVTLHLTVTPAYDFSDSQTAEDTIVVCEPTITIGDVTFGHSETRICTLQTIHGCDSIVKKTVFLNNPAISNYYFTIACPPAVYDTLNFGETEMPVALGTPYPDRVIHHLTAYYPSYIEDSVTVTHDAPADSMFPAGVTAVTWTATDPCGNTATCTQYVYIACRPCPPAIDFDGNVYESVFIKGDCWTQTNLKSRHYSDGDPIPDIYTYYDALYPDTTWNTATFGKLYNWYAAVDTAGGIATNAYGHIQGICPEGWYLPPIEKYRGIAEYGAAALKSHLHWIDGGGTNETGFSALPAGYYDNSDRFYKSLMGEAYFWSTTFIEGQTTAKYFTLNYYCDKGLERYADRGLGYSIRCIKEKE